MSGCRESHAAQPAWEPGVDQRVLCCLPVPKPRLQKPQSVAVRACFIIAGPGVNQAGGCHINRTSSGMHLGQRG